MQPPKLYAPVNARFWTLRNIEGCPDIDTPITRLIMRIRCRGGWKWQIKKNKKNSAWDNKILEHDQECLDSHDLDEIEFL